MFEKRNISEEEALKRACKQNGFEFIPKNNEPSKTITIVNDDGKEMVIDDKCNIVKDVNNCTLYSDGSILLKYGGYIKDGYFIPYSSQVEADEHMSDCLQEKR